MDQIPDRCCDSCGKVYNPLLGDCFWSGPYDVDGETYEDLCDDCRRELVGDLDDVVAARQQRSAPPSSPA